MTEFQARVATPFAVLGIRADDRFVIGIEFLPISTPILVPHKNSIAYLACVQLNSYLDNPRFQFDLPLRLLGTARQIQTWQAIQSIRSGETITYGELASRVQSVPRAVGQACGRNPIPVVIPCHRIISAGGNLGGFMGGNDTDPLAIKRWLLMHEGHSF